MVLGCRRAGNDVRIEVWDTGKGIPHDRHEEIFQEFYQLDNPERAAFDLSHCLVLVIDDEAAVQEGMASGLPILHKPLNPARLRTLIANLLREHTRAA